MEKPWAALPISEQSAEKAFDLVMDQAGAILPKRDAVDIRIINETKNGIATFGGKESSKPSGIIDSQEQVGGWPELKSKIAPLDSDHDGMPDEWEEVHGLDKNDPEDRNQTNKEGYTMLEVYLNSL
ncbi:MAG: hypothetical protein R2879_19725 [Saprospiraceae bacterium]